MKFDRFKGDMYVRLSNGYIAVNRTQCIQPQDSKVHDFDKVMRAVEVYDGK